MHPFVRMMLHQMMYDMTMDTTDDNRHTEPTDAAHTDEEHNTTLPDTEPLVAVREDEGTITVAGADPKLVWSIGETTATVIVRDQTIAECDVGFPIGETTRVNKNGVTTYHLHPR